MGYLMSQLTDWYPLQQIIKQEGIFLGNAYPSWGLITISSPSSHLILMTDHQWWSCNMTWNMQKKSLKLVFSSIYVVVNFVLDSCQYLRQNTKVGLQISGRRRRGKDFSEMMDRGRWNQTRSSAIKDICWRHLCCVVRVRRRLRWICRGCDMRQKREEWGSVGVRRRHEYNWDI